MSAEMDAFLLEFETELRSYIDAERSRIETERDFLSAVFDGRTDGITIEDVSSDLVNSYLTSYLGQFIPVEEDL